MIKQYTIFGHRIRIFTNSQTLWDRLADIAIDAREDLPPAGELNFSFEIGEERLEVRQEGELVYHGYDLDALTTQLDLRISHSVLKEIDGAIRLHGGLATIGKRNTLIIGDKNSGKTTLLLNLLLKGHGAHCDENLIVRGGQVIPYPRKFHVKDGTLELLPDLAARVGHLRGYDYHLGGKFRFVQPPDLGNAWNISPLDPTDIILLRPGFDQPPRILRTSQIDMLKALLFQTTNLSKTPANQIEMLTSMVRSCACHTMQVGEPEATAGLLLQAMRG